MDYKRFHDVVSILAGATLWGRTPEEAVRFRGSIQPESPTPAEIEEVMGMTLRQIQQRMRAFQDAHDAHDAHDAQQDG